MVSIIVSSYNTKIFDQLDRSIKNTIGIPYELIRIKNPGLMGICEAYNIGGAMAKFPYLCFAHEDLIFQTEDWGINLIKHFLDNEQLGLIGVAGGVYKPYVLSGWDASWGGKMVKMNINQASKQKKEPILLNSNPHKKTSERVVALDGCFLCTKSSIFSSIKFDQNTFKNYHCYDIDYSLSINESYHVEVVFDILFTHFSIGGFDKNWLDETVKMHRKWNNKLPYFIHPPTLKQVRIEETGAFYFLLNKVLQFNYGYKYLFKTLFSKKFITLIGIKNWLWIQLKLPVSLLYSIMK